MTSPISSSDFSFEAELLRVHINSMLVKWGSSKPPRGGLHASSVLAPDAEWCARRHVLNYVYPERAEQPEAKPWDAHQNAVFANGWEVHTWWQNVFSVSSDCLETEKPHYDEVRQLWFTPDALLKFAGEVYVVEIKGYKQEFYEKMGEEPPEAAMLQCNLYLHLLGLKYGIVLVENKNTQDYRLWVIEHNPELAQLYTHRMYDVKGATIMVKKHGNSKLPNRVCSSPQDRLAQKCPMKNLCFSSEVE